MDEEFAIRRLVEFLYSWDAKIYTLTEDFVEITYETDDGCKCSSRCNAETHYYDIPWDKIMKGEIVEFIDEENKRRKEEKLEKERLRKIEQEKVEEQKRLKDLQQEKDLFLKLKEKYEP